MSGSVAVEWQRQVKDPPTTGPCGGRHFGDPGEPLSSVLRDRELVAYYRVPGYSAPIPVCDSCDRGIIVGTLAWATTYDDDGAAYLFLSTAAESGAERWDTSALPPATRVLGRHIERSLDGDLATYLTAWQDALTYALAHPLEAVALLREMDAAVGDFTDPDRIGGANDSARRRMFAELTLVLGEAVRHG